MCAGGFRNSTRATDQETYRQLLPGYVRHFVERAAPLLDLHIKGDPDAAFSLAPNRPRAADLLLASLELYPESARETLTVYKPTIGEDAVWMQPRRAGVRLPVRLDSGEIRGRRATGRRVYRSLRHRAVSSPYRASLRRTARAARRRRICLMTAARVKTSPSCWSRDWSVCANQATGT